MEALSARLVCLAAALSAAHGFVITPNARWSLPVDSRSTAGLSRVASYASHLDSLEPPHGDISVGLPGRYAPPFDPALQVRVPPGDRHVGRWEWAGGQVGTEAGGRCMLSCCGRARRTV